MSATSLRFSFVLLAATAWLALSCEEAPDAPDALGTAGAPTTGADFVGRDTCVACHEKQHQGHQGSHHDLAMEPATPATVLGDFDNATFERFGVTTRFYRDGDRFMVETDGPDGALTVYEVSHTFGVFPLQQYLVPFPRGRRQALSICWDSRPKAEGGQRWFHLYQEHIAHDDPLHWTGRHQNWNAMCADCHSTNLRKNYDLATDTYHTTWSEIDVSCEACHGPASHHLEWARSRSTDNPSPDYPNKGFAAAIRKESTWAFEPGAVTATRRGEGAPHHQTESCGRCHSRRATLDEGPAGAHLLDTHRVALLDDPVQYHADGQIRDEVYVYGSFVQSKMYHKGVTCTDCHDPHSVKPLAQGNALCVRCHMPSHFDTPAHHHHPVGSGGAQCVSCHMPTRNYMVVDPRLDHSIRIPRPDLTAQIGTPNACNGCHGEKSPQWAAAAIRGWRGGDYRPPRHFGPALHAGRIGLRGAVPLLVAIANDPEQPAIARGSALNLLGRQPGSRMGQAALLQGLLDPDPLARLGALDGLGDHMPGPGWSAAPLLGDPVRAVRADAAQLLAAAPRDQRNPADEKRFAAALAEYRAFQQLHADEPWAHTNLGILAALEGRRSEAATEYRNAIRVDPTWVAAYANLADIHREAGEEDQCEKILREGIHQAVDAAALHNALGMALSRQGRRKEALQALRNATVLAPAVPRFAYTYGVALHGADQAGEAIRVLTAAHRRAPGDYDIVYALATFQRDAGNRERAVHWAQVLLRLAPEDQAARQLFQSLTRRR